MEGLTWTLSFCARPGESILTDSGGAARQLMAAGAFEIAGGPVVVAIAVTIHVAVVRCKELAAAAHWQMKQKQETWWAERKDKAKAATGGRSSLMCVCVLWNRFIFYVRLCAGHIRWKLNAYLCVFYLLCAALWSIVLF